MVGWGGRLVAREGVVGERLHCARRGCTALVFARGIRCCCDSEEVEAAAAQGCRGKCDGRGGFAPCHLCHFTAL